MYLCASERAERRGNKVSMETRELCLIGNNSSKISEIRNSINTAGTAPPCPISIAFLFIHAFYLFTETDGVQSVFYDKYTNGFGCSRSHFSVLPISSMNGYGERERDTLIDIINYQCPNPNITLNSNLTLSKPLKKTTPPETLCEGKKQNLSVRRYFI